jgi:hypothetical protein
LHNKHNVAMSRTEALLMEAGHEFGQRP